MRKLVLWGHHVDEYQEMFDLSEHDFKASVLEYGCGPSAVNVEIHDSNAHVISCDPLFNLDKSTLSSKVSLVFEQMVDAVKEEQDKFDFSHYHSLEKLIARRKQGLDAFFADYEQGRKDNRYQALNEHSLPFGDFSFEYALSSHYLFADMEEQDVSFHLNLIRELARVAREVRIFPLIDRFGEPSPLLGPVLLGLQKENYGVEVREVPYRLQTKGNAMLRIWAQVCPVG
tara:strand:- start:239 stop:925 length:687 start_codon:yes stop_codon:yes gene_type:complete